MVMIQRLAIFLVIFAQVAFCCWPFWKKTSKNDDFKKNGKKENSTGTQTTLAGASTTTSPTTSTKLITTAYPGKDQFLKKLQILNINSGCTGLLTKQVNGINLAKDDANNCPNNVFGYLAFCTHQCYAENKDSKGGSTVSSVVCPKLDLSGDADPYALTFACKCRVPVMTSVQDLIFNTTMHSWKEVEDVHTKECPNATLTTTTATFSTTIPTTTTTTTGSTTTTVKKVKK